MAALRGLPIDTASLTLRVLVAEDAPTIFRMSREPGLQAGLPSQVYRDEAHAAAVLAFLISQYDVPGDPRAGPVVLGVCLRTSGELIGHVGFSPLGDAVEVGFAIEQAHQRHGLATEAVRSACEWAAQAFCLPAVVAVTAAGNRASQGVLRRAGFAASGETVMPFQGVEQPVVCFERRVGPFPHEPDGSRETRRLGVTWRQTIRSS